VERRDQSDEKPIEVTFQNLALGGMGGVGDHQLNDDEDVQDDFVEEGKDFDLDLPDALLQSFSTGTDADELLQREYELLSASSLTEGEDGVGLDGEILNGVYFDKLELELSAIEQAMSQFEGRLDLLRAQAQDLLQTLQTDRVAELPEEVEEMTVKDRLAIAAAEGDSRQ